MSVVKTYRADWGRTIDEALRAIESVFTDITDEVALLRDEDMRGARDVVLRVLDRPVCHCRAFLEVEAERIGMPVDAEGAVHIRQERVEFEHVVFVDDDNGNEAVERLDVQRS